MKNLLLFAAMLFVSGVCAQNVPNGSFEDWADGEPVGWRTYNIQLKVTVTQSSDAHSGTYAAGGDVDSVYNVNISPFLLSDSIDGKYGFPVSQKFGALQFWYRLFSDSGDIMPVVMGIYDSAGVGLGVGGVTFTTAAQYTLATVPLLYNNKPNAAARAHISFTISDTAGTGKAHLGSFYIIDDVQLVNPSGIAEEQTGISYLSMFPNPATNTLYLGYTLNTATPVHITLTDLAGRNIYSLHQSHVSEGQQVEKIDVSNLAAGLYVCTISTGTGMVSRKVQVVR